MTVPSHPAGTTRQQVEADTARIQADLLGLSHGHDPFVAAVRATRMPMIITDPRLPDNPVVFANDAFCRLTGYAREEILGLNCRFLQGPETDQAVIARIRAAIRAVQSIEVDIRNYRKDGSTFWNRLLLAPVRDAAGELAYFFASQLDVTMERERLAGLESDKAALVAAINDRHLEQEASERQLRFATEAGRLGIWRLDLETEELSASRRFKQHFGWNPDLPMRRADVYARMPPEDRVRATIAARDLVSPDGYIIEYRVNQPDGTLRWIEVRAQAEGAGRGNPRYLTGVSLDITERKASEHMARALADLDARLAVIDDPVELAFTAAQVLGETINVSRAGYGTVDLAAETIHIDRDWNAPGTNSLAGTLAFRDYGSYIEDLKRGETVIVSDAETDPRTSLTAAALKGIHAQSFINMPVTEHEGLVALLYLNHRTAREWSPEELSFIREVAQRARFGVERRRAEQALRELATSLESQVAARTDQLMQTEATLRQSQKMEAVGQLTGGLAHDFNNLLTGITGSLELLKIRVAQGRLVEVDRYIMAAEGAARRAAALTHRLLAFSRRQTLTPQSTDVNQLIAGMEELIRRTAGPGIQLDVVGSGGLWNTLVDQSQLENALLNLCINARDAMPNGGRITIETANRWIDQSAGRTMDGLAPGQYVALAVSDNGTGMSRETLAKAFDPFFTTKPIGQGTGLGLSMIYGFAQQSGGQARIYSELGQGTTVRLYLPRHRGETEQAETPAALDQAPRTQTGATVLIIDDEPTVRMLLSDVLRELGYRTIEATDGAAGLKVLQSPAPIDLLITDVGLPNGLNGRQVADAARHMRPDLKVLFITGYAENAVIEHGHLDPGMHVLTKPFTMEFLGSRVKELVG